MADVFFGVDTYDLTDLTLTDTQVTGKVLIALRAARRLQTPYGALALINDDPDFGYDVLQLLNQKNTRENVLLAGSQIEAELLKDEQIQNVVVNITSPAADSYLITIDIDSSAGPFKLTLPISLVSFKILFVDNG